MERIHQAVWGMRVTAGFLAVLEVLRDQVRLLGVQFRALGVNVIDQETEKTSLRYVTRTQPGEEVRWEVLVVPEAPVAGGPIPLAWRSRQMLYRPDLHQEDIYRERSWADSHPISPVRCVVDVPFSHGTLAINSPSPYAFSAADLEVVQEAARILSDGFRRLDDLQALECRAQEAEALAKALAASEAQYRSLFAEMGHGFSLNELLFDGAGTPVDLVTLEVNQAFGEMLGEKRLSRVGQPASQFLEPAELEKWVQFFGRLVAKSSAAHFEQFFPVHQKWFHGYAYALNRRQFAVLFEDITDRKRAEDEANLNLSLQQVRNQILQMGEASDWEGVVRTVHRELGSWVKFWFCSIQFIDQQTGTFTYYTTVFAPEDWHLQGKEQLPLPLSLRKVVETGQVLYRRTRAEVEAYKDEVKPEACSVVDVPFQGGTLAMNSIYENAFSARDIQILERFAQVVSEGYQRLMDLKHLAQAQLQLQQAQRLQAVGQLASGIAHNFNNLLQVVVANLDLVAVAESAKKQEYLEEAGTAVMRGAELVRQLMLYAQGGGRAFSPQRLSLKAVVERTISLCRETIGPCFDLEVDLPGDLPQVWGDASQIEQVLLNLYLNARDALDGVQRPNCWIRTTAQMACANLPAATGGAYIQLCISDNGVGMEAAVRERIYEPFFTTKEVGKGTGLGLSTTYGIVQRHGGWIECESTVGVGTRFSVYLPVAMGVADAQDRESAPDLPTGTETIRQTDD
ncbi:MAG: hypothetical protein IT369_11640 [Candidatus Latescibacteria bacterium]|nr:hypothetical protein [Candidatus Latescibacterota bacterium]